MFQPHRYSRTESCWHDFTNCFTLSDELFITDIYAAGEAPIAGITSEKLAAEIKHKSCSYLPRGEGFAEQIFPKLRTGDVFITLGAGDGWKVGMEILEKLNA